MRFHRLNRISTALAGLESRLAGISLTLVFALLILNIITRASGQAMSWVDEAAVMAMVWMAFFAGSASLATGANIAMTLVQDAVPKPIRQALGLLVHLILLLFFLVLSGLVWNWFNPVLLYQVGGNVTEFSLTDFNFIYEEPTMTLGIRKFWVWLIMPWFALSGTFHSLVNLLTAVSALRNSGTPGSEEGTA